METQLKPPKQFARVLTKARKLAAQISRLGAANDKLRTRLGAQDTELAELRKRVRELERIRAEAKRRLERLVNQLPAK